RARGRRLLLASPRETGTDRGARRGGLGGGGRRVLGHAAAGEPAGRARLPAERRAREPPCAHGPLAPAPAALSRPAGAAAAGVDSLPFLVVVAPLCDSA